MVAITLKPNASIWIKCCDSDGRFLYAARLCAELS